MSNLWFNIRFGKYHLQLDNSWRLSFSRNPFWDREPGEYDDVSWFAIYCAFGRHF